MTFGSVLQLNRRDGRNVRIEKTPAGRTPAGDGSRVASGEALRATTAIQI